MTKQEETIIESLEQQTGKIKHFEATLPFSHQGDGTFTGYGKSEEFKWDAAGVDYTAARHGLDMGRARELFNNEEWDQLADELNEANMAKKKPVETLVVALWNGKAVGTMKNYNVVPHIDLLEAIREANLEDNATGYMDKFGMVIDLSVSDKQTYIWLRMINGHSGHKALRYYTLFKVGQYEFEIPIHDRRRHLSRVEETKNNLTEMVNEVGDIKVEIKLEAMSAAEALDAITNEVKTFNKRQEIIWDMVESNKTLKNAMDVIIKIAAFTERKGYKSAASKMIDAIMTKVS